MDEIARGPFALMYPVIARQAMSESGIRDGTCLDIGSGPGQLAIALASHSDLDILAVDPSRDVQTIAVTNIRDSGCRGRVQPVCGDVHQLPVCGGAVDLVVSRGSIFFWDDPVQALCECYRVLAPGGRTFIGGGFGTPALKEMITRRMREIDPGWEKKVAERMQLRDQIPEQMGMAGISDYAIVDDGTGFWIMMEKQ
ncbi:MAG: class I SAM-dependent methyltransferase [Methanomicrobiales archaeon]